MARTWTQAPSNLPPQPFFGRGNLALRPRFLRTLCPFCDSVGPYNQGASAPPFPDRRVGFTTSLQPAACAAHLGLAGLYDPSDALTTGILMPGARTPPLALIAGGIYASTSATLLPWGRLGFTTPARHPHDRYSCTTSSDLLTKARIAPCTYSPPQARPGL